MTPRERLWGYGGVGQAPDGTIWTVASAAKDTGPATRQIDEIALQLGVADVAASKRFYIDREGIFASPARPLSRPPKPPG